MLDRALQLAARSIDQGQFTQARQALARHLQRSPDDANANSLMCAALSRLGLRDQAVFYAERVVALRPDNPGALTALGNTLSLAGRAPEAIGPLQKAVTLDPGCLGAAVALASALADAELAMAAVAHGSAALSRFPESPELCVSLGAALLSAGYPEEAERTLREGLLRAPEHPMLLLRLASTLNYVPATDPAELLRAHRAFGDALVANVARPPRRTAPVWNGDRPIRIGLLSPDLCRHSVTFFLEPLVENLAPAAASLYFYALGEVEDEVTARLKSRAAGWRRLAGLDDPAAAGRILDDRLDLLIDLAGYTSTPGLRILAHQPAPVLATYIGYPATTGLATVRYRIVDSRTDPLHGPFAADRHASESLVRMDPCFLCYRPATSLASAGTAKPPAASGAPFTFGSFNIVAKLNDPLIRLWSSVLRNVPGSRLLLKAAKLREPALRDDLRRRFTAAGIAPDRIDFHDWVRSTDEHLAMYARVDAALDTHPYCGTTTTCEALSMGVPVVTLVGRSHASRVGLSLLSAVGLEHLAAGNQEEYVGIATALAAEPARLADLRSTLPERLRRSPLCDGAAFAATFERAVRSMLQPADGSL